VIPRISLRQALADPALLGGVLEGESWKPWRTLLLAAMGEELTEDERPVFKKFTGREREPGRRVEEFDGNGIAPFSLRRAGPRVLDSGDDGGRVRTTARDREAAYAAYDRSCSRLKYRSGRSSRARDRVDRGRAVLRPPDMQAVRG
jgi:hypothetical protein